MSIVSGESDFNDIDELSSSAASSLSVPKLLSEKRKISKTGSYPLEQFQRTPRKNSDSEGQGQDEQSEDRNEIYEWWEDQISSKSELE